MGLPVRCVLSREDSSLVYTIPVCVDPSEASTNCCDFCNLSIHSVNGVNLVFGTSPNILLQRGISEFSTPVVLAY